MLYSRILITGANGLLGQELVSLLEQFPEYDVLATGRDEASMVVDGSGGYVQMDIKAHKEVRQVFEDFAPDVVINCAAMTQVDLCEQERDRCWQVNVDAVDHLAHCCLKIGSRLIQVSTDFIFDGEEGPYREDARPNPVNFYGKSKLAAENAVRRAGLDQWAIARTVLVYGTGNHLKRSNIVLWILSALSKGEPIHVVTDQFRSPTYAADLAAGIERMVRFKKHGVYHLSGSEQVSIYDFARTVAEVFDLDASLIHPTDGSRFQQPAKRPPRTGFIILKAASELGYHPRSLRKALSHLGLRLGISVTTS